MPPRKSRANLVTLFTPLLMLAVVLGTMPSDALMVDLASHFMGQYALGAIGLALLALYYKSDKAYFAALALCFTISVVPLASFFPLTQAATPDAQRIKILQANILFLNDDPAKMRDLIAQEKPDIIVTAETPPEFAAMFETLKHDYPWQDVHADDDTPRGIGVISRIPLKNISLTSFDMPSVPAQVFTAGLDGQEVTFVSIHPFTPIQNITRRNNEFRLVGERFSKASTGNLVVLGDFNATPYCHAYKSLLKTLCLRNARDGFGIYPTWPVFYPTPFVRIPIDHVLVSDNIRVADFHTGTDIGSDHLPTITEISLKAKP